MGKMKTSFVGGTDDQPVKPSYDKKAKEAKRMQREGASHVNTLDTTNEETTQVEAVSSQKAKKQKVRSKKYKEVATKVDKNRLYQVEDAVELVKSTSYSSFEGTVELHLVIRKEGFSAQVTLPFAAGKKKVVEFANDETLEKLKSGKIDFDVLLATADLMPKLVPFAKVLGPRGLMPNPKNGTLVKSADDAKNFSTAQATIKTEKKAPVIHTVIGKVSQDTQEIVENFNTVITAINKKQVVKAYIKSTMSPSVRLQIA